MRVGNGVVRDLGKGAGWDRAGELTSDLWPGKAEGVKSKTCKTNKLPTLLVGSVDIQQLTSLYLLS